MDAEIEALARQISTAGFPDYVHSMAVAKAFRRQGVTLPWGAFFAPTRPPDGYYEGLAEAGLTHVEFGTESLCDTQLKR